MARKNRRATKKAPPVRGSDGPQALRFTAVNGGLAAAGLVTLGLGYWLLAQGSVTAAPLLLVLGYVVLLPLAIIL